MKKSILSMVLLSGLALSVGAQTAQAGPDKNKDSAESRVEVNLTKDKGHEDNEGPYRDRLAIVRKPTVYKFEGAISKNPFTLPNLNPARDTMYMAIHDDRREDPDNIKSNHKPTPWTLTGKMSELTGTGGKLAGAVLNITGNDSEKYLFFPKEADPTDPQADLEFEQLPFSTQTLVSNDFKVENKIAMTAGSNDETAIMERTKLDNPTELGVYTNLGDASLSIPKNAGNTISAYEGTITWTLMAQ